MRTIGRVGEDIAGLIWLLGVLLALLSVPALAGGSVALAMLSAPRDRRTPVQGSRLMWGAVLAVVGLAVPARIAWATHEERFYKELEPGMLMLAGMAGGSLLLLGLGPFVSWALTLPDRFAVRLPRPLRLPARRLAGHQPGTAGGVAMTMVATAVATAVMIVAAAQTAQERSFSPSQAPYGALVVQVSSDEEARVARAALRQEIPSAPIVQSEGTGKGYLLYFHNDLAGVDPHIGDQALLGYLTGDLSTPYDEGTAVLVTSEDVGDIPLDIGYSLDTPSGETLRRSIPAIAVKPADPGRTDLFIPAKVLRDLGVGLTPNRLIIDPAFHRTSAAEQERLDRRLGVGTPSYVERGFEASTGWLFVFVPMILLALVGALVATGSVADSLRWRRVLLRVTGGSGVRLRSYAVCRTWLAAACGTALGVAAGAATGLLLAWPGTAADRYDPLPRVAFDTPWLPIAVLVVGFPLLAAALAALLPPGSGPRVRPS
ncbi:hypothetical protein GCM10012278_32230 [Nonomuraea glycinis]|uniref:FtsX-like permease family protein n=1 Tax=Nonomuraea glycinis TaxID=2047744 RepID=A0A918A4S8_9ACTN|nr:hypothetical protein GCM10012278_32230 [Nonomuraea glycinis]